MAMNMMSMLGGGFPGMGGCQCGGSNQMGNMMGGGNPMQQQMMQAQLQEATAKAQEVAARAELQMARAKEALANVELTAAKKLDLTMEAMYAAMQAAGVAAQSRHIAPVADAMLQEAGFGQAPQPQAPNPATGQEGARQGIETANPMDGAQ